MGRGEGKPHRPVLRTLDLGVDRRGGHPDHARVDDPAGLDLRKPQPWQFMSAAELIAEIGRMQKER